MTLGRHTVRELLAGRPSLGPIRSPWEHEPPEDPHGLQAKRPANFAGVPSPRTPLDDQTPAAWSQPARTRRPSTARTVIRVSAGATELAAVTLVVVHVIASALRTPARPGEVFGVARAVAAARPDVSAIGGPWPQEAFGAVVAAWVAPTGALQRHATAQVAVREAMAVAGVTVVLVLWLLVRRLRLAVPSRIAAVLLLGVLPTGTALLTEVRPGLLGAVALLLATTLVAGTRIGATHRVVALLALTAATLLVPAALPALLAAIAVLLAQGDLAGGLDRRTRAALAVLVGCLALAAVVVAVGSPAPWRAWLASASPTPGPVPDLSELPLLLAALALTVAALGQRWLRAPAVAVVTLLSTALLVAPARADLVAMALPLTAVVAVAGAEDRIVALWAARARTARRRPADPALRAVAALACAVVALGALAAVAARPVVQPTPPAATAVAAWFDREVTGGPPLVVDDGLWPELLKAGLPDTRLRTLSRTPLDESVQWRVTAGDVDRSGAVAAGWLPYAAFGGGAGRVTVLRRLQLTPGAFEAKSAQERTDRATFGTALAAHPRLRLVPSAAAALRSGDVDQRLMSTLADLAGRHSLTVADFPAVPGEQRDGPPLHRVLFSTVDDRSAADPVGMSPIQTWFDRQLSIYKPAAVELTPGGLLIRYTVPDTPS